VYYALGFALGFVKANKLHRDGSLRLRQRLARSDYDSWLKGCYWAYLERVSMS